MLTTLKNAFKIKELRDKILFTFAMLVVIRIGSQLPVPGVNGEYFRSWFAAQGAALLASLMRLPAVRSSICPF